MDFYIFYLKELFSFFHFFFSSRLFIHKMQTKASLLALFAFIFTLFIASTVVEAAEDKESYGTGNKKRIR